MSSAEAYGIYDERDTLHQPCVLYKDYNGFWSPICALYWSTSSRVLVSKHPFSCVEEIISQYCPQCMSRYMEDEVRTSQNRCPACYQCPNCCGILTEGASSSGLDTFSCNGCNWCTEKADIATISPSNDLFIGILKSLKEEENNSALSQSLSKQHDSSIRWKLSDLESSLMSKSVVLKNNGSNSIILPNEAPSSDENETDTEVTTLNQRISQPGMQQRLISDLIPIRIHLRSKRTLRCRKDVEEGKMSILVQPKLFPLEGDSSQKLQRGKWFVKDSSAIHQAPTIVITKLPDCFLLQHNEVSYLYLTVTNPKDFKMVVTMRSIPSKNLIPESPGESNTIQRLPFLSKTSSKTSDLQFVNTDGSDGVDGIRFELGAFEDELLRDDSDDSSDEGGFDVTTPELNTRGRSCAVSHNIAYLVIKVSSINNSNDDEGDNKAVFAYVLPLTVSTTEGDDSQTNPNTFEFQSVIAFPNIE